MAAYTHVDGALGSEASTREVALRDLLQVLRRRRSTIIASVLCCTALATTGALLFEPRFTSQAVLIIDPRTTAVTDIDAVISNLPREAAAIRTEIDMITSSATAAKVVDRLGLVHDPDFNGAIERPSAIDRAVAGINDTFGYDLSPLHQQITGYLTSAGIGVKEPTTPEKERAAVIAEVRRGLSATSDAQSYTIVVSFKAKEPEKAARIANAFVDEYLLDQLNTKQEVTQQANKWLEDRINELRAQVEVSDKAVQDYRAQQGLVLGGASGETFLSQQLAELNRALVVAQTERGRAEARAQNARLVARSPTEGNAAEVLGSPLIQRLGEEESAIARRLAEYRTRYGDQHPAVQAYVTQLTNLRQKMREEVTKIMAVINNEVEIARAREREMEAALKKLTAETAGELGANVRLAQLQREADANRRVYEGLLQRLVETREQGDLQQRDARVVSKAEPPLEPSTPGKKLFVGGGLAVGLLIGMFLAFLRDHLNKTFRNTQHVEETIGVPAIGLVPSLPHHRNAKPEDYVLDRPRSEYSEAVRAIGVSLYARGALNTGSVVMVTSAVPGEGKTTVCLTMARMLASSGRRVLLLECDLRCPRIGNVLGDNAPGDLSDLIVGKAEWNDVVQVDGRTGLHYVVGRPHCDHPQELLGSEKLASIIKFASLEYDCVILDTPPMAVVADAGVLTRSATECLFVVRWEQTPRAVVQRAIDRLTELGRDVTSVVLSRVDLKKLARTDASEEAYGMNEARRYYTR